MDGYARWYSGVDSADIMEDDDPDARIDRAFETLDTACPSDAARYRKEWDRGLMTLTELEKIAARRRPTGGGCATFENLAQRYEFVARKAALGFNYFVGFKDSGDPAKQYGLSYAFDELIAVDGLYLKDLEGLIH